MRWVFTGPTQVTDRQLEWLREVLDGLVVADEYVTGGAHGVDIFVAQHFLYKHPDAKHRICAPAAQYAAIAVERLEKAGAEVERCPGGPEPYRTRNEAMFQPAPEYQRLAAIVKSHEFYRSGEWMTINIARRLGVPVNLYALPKEH